MGLAEDPDSRQLTSEVDNLLLKPGEEVLTLDLREELHPAQIQAIALQVAPLEEKNTRWLIVYNFLTILRRFTKKKTVFRIRIDFPDPAFFLIADPDSGSGSRFRIRIPDPDPGFDDLKLKKIYN